MGEEKTYQGFDKNKDPLRQKPLVYNPMYMLFV